jgi:cytidyltransferase-like protein
MQSMSLSKIIPFAELVERVRQMRAEGSTVVHCHGLFDLLHIGHIRHLSQARSFGDLLVVTVTADQLLDQTRQPSFSASLRAEALASLDCVDLVAISTEAIKDTLRALRPDLYVIQPDRPTDGPPNLSDVELAAATEVGARIVATEDVDFRSSNLINRFMATFPTHIQEYLHLFSRRHQTGELLDLLERMSELKVLIIGDSILDEYQFCHTLGTSSKDPVIAMQYDSHDLFAGGVLAVANHTSSFVRKVRLLSVIGEQDSHEELIRSALSSNIIPRLFHQAGAPTTIKRRFVEGYTLNKLFEIYVMDDSGLAAEADHRLCEQLRDELTACDLVIVADYGHGAISPAARKVLVEHAPYLAVNTQANAGNRGFHSLTCYDRADYVSIAEHEVRLEMRDSRGDIKPMIDRLAASMTTDLFVVTRGRKGCTLRVGEGLFVEVPAFAQKVVDRIGAGDAFLSVTAIHKDRVRQSLESLLAGALPV